MLAQRKRLPFLISGFCVPCFIIFEAMPACNLLEGIGQICHLRPRSKCSVMQHAPNCIGDEARSTAAAYTMMVLFIRLSLLLEFIDLFHLEACFKACILKCIDSYFQCTGWAVVVLRLPGFFGLLVCCLVRSFSDTYLYVHTWYLFVLLRWAVYHFLISFLPQTGTWYLWFYFWVSLNFWFGTKVHWGNLLVDLAVVLERLFVGTLFCRRVHASIHRFKGAGTEHFWIAQVDQWNSL